ncbi:YdcF family protein [Leptolyngbya sp. FACHB-261]|uniref:YdcF family protein n=1 Tax=Leptolyngbya sp. FACHB-261 TaxID=2692806 RepID=UPI00168A29B5|nr:YdcF family protein [Leptolyngbya sp. FACHB-261]MBD2102141.1 YdcF family protein [Leptolyngbya sp. FACHB-261]
MKRLRLLSVLLVCFTTSALIMKGHSEPTEQPQAILVLGGDREREDFAADFAQQHPDLPIWVSSGTNLEYSEWTFDQAGVAPSRVQRDYRAVDTVTNFTTLVDDLEAQGIHSLYLITSDYHMRRARVIGEIVLGSQGISLWPIAVPSHRSPEPLSKVARDGARALLWLVTGQTGSTLHQRSGSMNASPPVSPASSREPLLWLAVLAD